MTAQAALGSIVSGWTVRVMPFGSGRTSLSQQLDRLTDAYLHSIIPLPKYDRRRRELEQRDHALAEQEGQLCAQAERHEQIAGLAISIEDFCSRVRSG